MKYAIKYFNSQQALLNKADEIIIKYFKKTTDLIDFVTQWRDCQTIVARVADFDIDIKDNLDIFKAAFSAHPHFKILISEKQDWSVLLNAGIPFFFIEGAKDFSTIRNYVNDGVSDIYIVEDMGFYLPEISEYLKEKEVQIRTYPNITQYNALTSDLGFFIRPEDIDLYEKYVDIIEFAGDFSKQSVLYDIYTSGEWYGNLKDLILNFNYNIDNRALLPSFGTCRLKCKKRCVFDKCNCCKDFYSIAEVMGKSNLIIEKE